MAEANQAIQIIKRPLITEKSTWESGRHNRYAFHVDMDARKGEIKSAIETLYNVRVNEVRTQVRKGKARRTRHGMTHTGDWKKALVELHPDDKIEMF